MVRETHEERLRKALIQEGMTERAARISAQRITQSNSDNLLAFAMAYRATGLDAETLAGVIARCAP